MTRPNLSVNNFLQSLPIIFGSLEFPAPRWLSAHCLSGTNWPLPLSWLPRERRSEAASPSAGSARLWATHWPCKRFLPNRVIFCLFLGRSEPCPQGALGAGLHDKMVGAAESVRTDFRIGANCPGIRPHRGSWPCKRVGFAPSQPIGPAGVSWRYSASAIRPRLLRPRSGASPDHRSKPARSADRPPARAGGGIGGQS